MHVVVVGAGIIGASVAEALAIGGADVVVLEMRSPGRGASQASAGILAPFTEADRGSPLLGLGARSLALFDGFIAGAAERSRRPIEYARTGTVEVAFDEAGVSHLRDAAEWITREGVECEWLDAQALTAFEPASSPEARGGLYIPHHGFVGVPQLVHALMLGARFAGAALAAPVEVVTIDPSGDQIEVRADHREWTTDAVVLAGGSWSNRLRVQGATLPPVHPVRGQLLHLAWPAETPMPRRVVWGPDCYTVPWSDRTLLVGATVEDVGFDERSTVEGVSALTDAVRRLLPGSSDAAVKDVRVGLRPGSPDGLPFIGPLPGAPRVVIAAGHYRNGVLLAPLTAAIVARYVLEGVEDPVMGVTGVGRHGGEGGGEGE